MLAVVAIVVALAAVSVVSVTQFAGKGEEGAPAVEIETVQAAIDTMTAYDGISLVTANDLSTAGSGLQGFSGQPPEGQSLAYPRDNPTTHGFCWDSTEKVMQPSGASTTSPCPAGPY